MTNRRTRTMLAAAATLALATTAGASDIYDIQGTPANGGWNLDASAYFPDSQGHFGLDTLYLEESVPGSAEHWFDIEVTVYRNRTAKGGIPLQDEMIAIDKKVTNQTMDLWTDFHMEIGLLDGSVLYPVNGLSFKRDPLPQEELDRFEDPPMFGESNTGAPSLWWFNDPTGANPGVAPGEMAQFWLGITVPGSLFQFLPDSQNGSEAATFVLRQHWTPTPGATGLLSIAGIASLRRRRR